MDFNRLYPKTKADTLSFNNIPVDIGLERLRWDVDVE
jgi:hypothetical protein